jgi:hypothetical protein
MVDARCGDDPVPLQPVPLHPEPLEGRLDEALATRGPFGLGEGDGASMLARRLDGPTAPLPVALPWADAVAAMYQQVGTFAQTFAHRRRHGLR